MYVCMCVCVCVCMFACMYVRMYSIALLYMYADMYITHTHTHTHTFVQKVDAGKATKPPAKKGRLEAEDARLESLAALKVRSQHMA